MTRSAASFTKVRAHAPGGARTVAPNVIPTVRGLRKVCFVTGTRAEFGLMRTTLDAIRSHPKLALQLVCTGMHLDPAHGRTIETVRAEGWTVDAEVPWQGGTAGSHAASTGRAMARLAETYEELGTDVVMVVGDRVEAFAAAAAGAISGKVVAHVHGGDRALGQVDDSLRHAISKLAHVHFPATKRSARRLVRMGEDAWRIMGVGSPGVDRIVGTAQPFQCYVRQMSGLTARQYGLLVLHPTGVDPEMEKARAEMVARAAADAGLGCVVVVYPNNDPGSAGIMEYWDSLRGDERFVLRRDVPRAAFLGLMRDAAVMIGNSSSGIIEAASFGTPVIDVGPRQEGRERGANVKNVPFSREKLAAALSAVWNGGRPRRCASRNIYGGGGAGERIADAIAGLDVNDRLLRKLVAY